VILDSSAIVAVVLREEGYLDLIERIDAASAVGVGAPTLVEASVVIRARSKPIRFPSWIGRSGTSV
jgi:ribonuclease VapC